MLPYLPSALTSLVPYSSEISRLSYYALSAGLLSSLPSIATGVANAAQSIKTQGMYEADGKTLKPKVKVIAAHAVANDVVIAASAYMWWVRRQSNSPTYAPDGWMVGLSAVLGVALLFAANLGGSLVYNYGIGLRMGKGKGKSS